MHDFRSRDLSYAQSTAALALTVLLVALVAVLMLSSPAGAGGSVGTPTYTVTVTKSGTGAGVVRSEPAGILCGDTGDACAVDFALGNPVTLVAESERGTRFKGWDGTVKGGSKSIVVPPPTDGLPIEVEAIFEKAARPTAKLLGKPLSGKPLPRKLNLRLDCEADVSCSLKVTVLLGIWASKKGYDYYRSQSGIYSPPSGGTSAWNASVAIDKATPLFYKRLNRSAGKLGAIRIVVQDVDTALGMAINQKALPGEKRPNNTHTNNPK